MKINYNIFIALLLVGAFFCWLITSNHISFNDKQKQEEVNETNLKNITEIAYNFSIPDSNEEIFLRCEGLNLEETANCFKENIKTFYNYSMENPFYTYDDGKYQLANINGNVMSLKPTNETLLNHLKEYGGRCCEWSLLYYQLCNLTAFNCSEELILNEDRVYHRYLVMFNESHTCKLDQINMECFEK